MSKNREEKKQNKKQPQFLPVRSDITPLECIKMVKCVVTFRMDEAGVYVHHREIFKVQCET